MKKDILARTKEWELTRTGKFETTGLDAVDKAFARDINDIFSNAVVVHPSPGRERYAAFLARAPEDRVFVGNFDSVIEFLAAVRRAAAGRRSIPKNAPVNRDALPLINVSRTFDISYDSNENQRDRYESGTLQGEDNKPIALVDSTQATLTYNVTLIAAEKSTLSLMCNTLASAMRWRKADKFKASDRLVNIEIELDCTILDAKAISFTDLSMPATENRIFAAQATLTVMTDLHTAAEVEARQIRVHTYSDVRK